MERVLVDFPFFRCGSLSPLVDKMFLKCEHRVQPSSNISCAVPPLDKISFLSRDRGVVIIDCSTFSHFEQSHLCRIVLRYWLCKAHYI